MIAKDLLIKGIAGVAAVVGAGGLVVCHQKGYFTSEEKEEDGDGGEEVKQVQVQKLDDKAFIGKVGLSCENLESATENSGVDCTKKADGENINIKQEQNKFEVSSIPESGGKIKLYRKQNGETEDGGYSRGLRFVIEDGSIAGTGANSDKKLEEFETYQIEEEGEENSTDNPKKYYLSRKTRAGVKIRELLGLPQDCNFPEGGSQECSITQENVNSIKFEGKTNATIAGNGTLRIDVATSDEVGDFPLGFKFTLTPNGGNLTITGNSGDLTINDGRATEFKIKRGEQDKKLLTLEKAWTLESLTKKVGLSCANGNNDVCTFASGSKLSLRKTDSSKGDYVVSASNTGGKIKLYKGTQGYENEFKFVIEEGDVTVDSSSGTKLEQFETYEIKKNETERKWYLTRRDDAGVGKGRALGLPSECNLSTFTSGTTICSDVSLDSDKLKLISFDGKDVNASPTVTNGANLKLTITKDTSDSGDFQEGYKFVFKTEQDVTVNGTSGKNIVFKSGSDLEFKIKKGQNSNTLTLERAWSVTDLGDKVGLSCSDTSKECDLVDNKINVHNGGSNKYTGMSKKEPGETKKVKYEDGQGGYNQGFKFYVEGDIELKDGSTSEGDENNKKIFKKNGSGAYYEIKKESNVWYLVKKG